MNEFIVDGHKLLLLQNGEQFFPQLSADIQRATHSIYLETYIFQIDEIGAHIAEQLRLAAMRGVSVRVLLDGFGSSRFPEDWQQRWIAGGVKLQWFRREKFSFSLRRHRLRRLHRKLAVFDERVAYVGGINIVDDIPKQQGLESSRLDYAIRMEGVLVEQVVASMRLLWATVRRTTFNRRRPYSRAYAPQLPFSSEKIQFVHRDSLRHRHQIESAYLKAIKEAKQEIILANPYFLPGKRFRRALIRAAKRGVRVVLLLQGQVEYHIQHYATQALYEYLIPAGIEIYEYQASFLHAKVAVIDQTWCTVGSSNIDPFSLLLAREANLFIQDAAFAGALRLSLLQAIEQDAKRITQLPQQNLIQHWRVRFSYALVRLLIGILVRRIW